jgi:GT2 family glycosyltransferase
MPAMAEAVRTAVLVLNHNGRRFLPDCLESLGKLEVFSQPGVAKDPACRDEVWLVDNASCDGSVSFVRQHFPWVRILAFEENLGFPRAYNQAVEAVQAEWVVFLNNDTRVEADWLSQLHACRVRHPQARAIASCLLSWDGEHVDFAGGDTFFFGQAWQRHWGEPRSQVPLEEQPVLFGCAGSLMFQREAFRRLGGFDAQYFSFFEDVDLGWRANLFGFQVWFCPQAVTYHRGHGTWGSGYPPRKRVLLERNSLASVYKNWGAERMGLFFLASCSLAFFRAWWAYAYPPLSWPPELTFDSLAHLQALAEVSQRLPQLKGQRAFIQAHRQQTDEALLPLFGAFTAPPLPEAPEYQRLYHQVLWRLGLAPGLPLPTWEEQLNQAAEAAAQELASIWPKALESSIASAQLQQEEDPLRRRVVPPALARAGWRTWEALELFWGGALTLESLSELREKLRDVAQAWERESRQAVVLSPPSVSMVVRTQNRPTYLRRALESLAQQEMRPQEVVVVNDGGADPSPFLADLPKLLPLRLVHQPQPLGRSTAAQRGLEEAQGVYVGFLDDDDQLRPNHLKVLLEAIGCGAKIPYADVEILVLEGTEENQVKARGYFNSPYDPIRLLFENYIPIMAVLFPRQWALEVGGFDLSLSYFEDWDLWLRLGEKCPFVRCPQVTATYYVRPALGHGQATVGDHRWPYFARVLEKHRRRLTPEAWTHYLRSYGEPRSLLLERLKGELGMLHDQLRGLQDHLNAIESSRLWQALQPLRKLRRFLRI